MTKKIMIAAWAISAGLTACAQKLDASKVPAAVKTSLEKNYPGAVAKWEKEKNMYEANFKYEGNKMSALFESDGTIKETETDIKPAELPAAVLLYVKEHYKGKTISEGAKITKSDGSISYEAEVDGKDVLFDKDGKFMQAGKE
jgi:hypothetical protein